MRQEGELEDAEDYCELLSLIYYFAPPLLLQKFELLLISVIPCLKQHYLSF